MAGRHQDDAPPTKGAESVVPDPREERARTDPVRLLGLLAQLGLLLLVFWGLRIDEPGFLRLAACATVGFVIHYFVPFRLKKQAFITISLVGAVVVMTVPEDQVTTPLIVAVLAAGTVAFAVSLGLAFYWILRLPIRFAARVAIILGIGAVLAYLRHILWFPQPVWLVIGAIFMFRLIIYAYDVRVAKEPEKLTDFCCYFFLLPNFYFPLFPVIDYTTFKKSFYADDIHRTAQQGIAWIARGTVHLCLFRLMYHRLLISPDDVQSFGTLCRYVLPAYWGYLEVSGKFHIIVGMIHLFGYKLPETNHKYFLSSSLTDFWRRINIYWKDFMVKVFYYPAYFRLRRVNETLALVVATVFVFVATMLLHAYQKFWLHGDATIPPAEFLFWGILGTLVVFNVLYEARHSRPPKRSKLVTVVQRVLATIAVYLTITVLWSMWSSTSLTAWFELVMYWR